MERIEGIYFYEEKTERFDSVVGSFYLWENLTVLRAYHGHDAVHLHLRGGGRLLRVQLRGEGRVRGGEPDYAGDFLRADPGVRNAVGADSARDLRGERHLGVGIRGGDCVSDSVLDLPDPER